ncbi:DUF3160 domain-containing protein [Pedosphaera parvula]|uniref:PBS lyase HEAT domain protein repeat-containing protein n=1 Tax=Pedosphaera parvula (strain Ellin514) TaxID=320771 RepID=B9XHN3_PEDPL|nr:DUF3160 domain-containing protein [Pedosphaera parvula]EEF60611.1 hypothetical protein Cflav_PD6201 [Pedosphaera parvula Ellin514]
MEWKNVADGLKAVVVSMRWLASTMLAVSLCALMPQVARCESYNLDKVKDIQAFQGSAAAKELLAKNGFVVADPAFNQIFEPYIKSPQTAEPTGQDWRGSVLPSFITTDSAWHTYHVLVEESVKQLEEVQSQRLLRLSRRLMAAAGDANNGNPDLVLYASVGLGLQDEEFRKSLGASAKRIVDGLRSGSGTVEMPVGFPLQAEQFRAQSFYTQSLELSDYFAARQWYGSAVLRLADKRETRLAVELARLVNKDPILLDLWKQLSEPFDTLLATAEDGTVPDYVAAEKVVLGNTGASTQLTDEKVAEIQKKLVAQLPMPRVSDQFLSPEQYAQYSKETRGFRLLPPRRLPCAVCFQQTVDPAIPNRMYPSGLDFLAASPTLHSPAAIRALQAQFGKEVSSAILKVDCGTLPDSLHGEAMQLLALLQKPLPSQAPAALRTEAWSDLQLWTQLGAWAEQRHTWALHVKNNMSVMGMVSPPRGMVAPYPEFFSKLAALTRQTAAAFEKAGLDETFDAKAAASKVAKLAELSQASRLGAKAREEMEKNSANLEQLYSLQNYIYEQHQKQLQQSQGQQAYQQIEQELKAFETRCAKGEATNAADMEMLKFFHESRQNLPKYLNDFAPICDRLADLSKKSLTGTGLTGDDAKWISSYGMALAHFHFYTGNSYEVPRDDFPIVSRVFSSPRTHSMLYAGVARPQSLYVIARDGDHLQLYRGAVLTYREFVKPNSELLDDQSWREMISKGQTPPAPPFTRSFYAEMTFAELLKRAHAQSLDRNGGYEELRTTLWQMSSRATEKDLSALLEILTHGDGENENREFVEGVAEIVSRLPWQSHQDQLIQLLSSSDDARANSAAHILVSQPTALDTNLFISNFDAQTPRARRFYCAILSRVPQQTDIIQDLYLHALRDQDDGVRWQSALAIKESHWNDARSSGALLARLNDTNEIVAAAAVYSLGKLGATNTAPVLFARLLTQLQSTNHSDEEVKEQALIVRRDIRDGQSERVLDIDDLSMRIYIGGEVVANARKRVGRRVPAMPITLPGHEYNLTGALIEALGEMSYAPAVDELFKLRGTEYDTEATIALEKAAPKRLSNLLLTTAKDKQLDSYLREQAMLSLVKIYATNHVRDLIPLLDDTTPIVYDVPIRGPEWRICDRAMVTISILLQWESPMAAMHFRPGQLEQLTERVRDWAKQNQAAQ